MIQNSWHTLHFKCSEYKIHQATLFYYNFLFGFTTGVAEDLFLILRSGISPAGLLRLYMVSGNLDQPQTRQVLYYLSGSKEILDFQNTTLTVTVTIIRFSKTD